MTNLITDRDIRAQVESTVGAFGHPITDFDVDAIVGEITSRYGLVNLDAIDSEAYWEIVRSHDISEGGSKHPTRMSR